MRDHRHTAIECYLGHLAPPHVRRHWRRQDRRWTKLWRRRLGPLRYALRLVLGIVPLLVFVGMLLAPSHTPLDRWLTTAFVVIFLVSLGDALLMMRRESHRSAHCQSRRYERWRRGDFDCDRVGAFVTGKTTAPTRSDIEARRAFWRWRVGQPFAASLGLPMIRHRRSNILLYVGVCAFILSLLLVWIQPNGSTFAIAGQISGMALYGAASVWWILDGARYRRLKLLAIEEHRCLACGCDLHGHDEDNPPRRCPECGLAWPLLLPPAYAREDLAGERRNYVFYRNPKVDPPWDEGSA